MVRLFSFIDKDARGNVGELGVVRPIDGRSGAALVGRPMISPEDAVLASARSLIAHGVA